jgi:hypothetical protein
MSVDRVTVTQDEIPWLATMTKPGDFASRNDRPVDRRDPST